MKKAQDTVAPASKVPVHGEGNCQATRNDNAGPGKPDESTDDLVKTE